ncbi:MAG: ATP-binding protein [Bacteroidales bacterium]|nr:ATP-binding protein [Bacteroidales bacterium]
MIRDIILTQKKELEQKLSEKYVPRQASLKECASDLIQVIIGPRRAGKSFFGMHQLAKNKLFGFVNFDDERLVRLQNFDEILDAVNAVYQNPTLLLLDEIQNLPDWELIVNRLQRQGFQLIITGSNSNLLSSELATHLTGRHLPVHLFTFSFREFLSSFGNDFTGTEKKEKLNDFLIHGGYPEPCMKTLDYKEYLKVLFDSILFKDIVKRYQIRQAAALENLATWLISNLTSEYSFNSLSKQVQISSVHTIKKYLGYLEESYIFFSLPGFSFKVSEQLKSNRKIYCFDNGFYKAKAFYFSEDWGKLLENMVASELLRRGLSDGTRLFYWKGRDGNEVDFVIQQGGKITQLIQVCWDLSHVKTMEREIRALLKASKELNCTNLLLITLDAESTDNYTWFGVKCEIVIVPAWKWLLENQQELNIPK